METNTPPTSSNKKQILVLGIFVLIMSLVATDIVNKAPEVSNGLFRAALVPIATSGTPGDGFSPLESGVPCTDRGSAILRVTGGSGSYDWKVENTGDFEILRDPATGATGSELTGVGPEVQVVAPRDTLNPATLPSEFIVSAKTTGSTAPGINFTVKPAPACVSEIEFLNPNPSAPVIASDSTLNIQQIRATLTNGVTYTYNQSQIPNLELAILLQPEGIQVGPSISLPTEITPGTFVDLVVDNKNVSPVYVPATPGAYQKINETSSGSKIFNLASDQVYIETLVVAETGSGGSCTAPGDTLEQNNDYYFENGSGGSPDRIALTPAAGSLSSVCVSYAYMSGNEIHASTPLSVVPSSCQNIQVDVFQGRGQGFYAPQEGDILPTGSVSAAIDFDTNDDTNNDLTRITLSNPSGSGLSFGQAVFELRFNIKSGLGERAKVASRSGSIYEIDVRDDVNAADTATNFAYAVNTLFGENAPFIAYTDLNNEAGVVLHSTEVGTHTNNYQCSINGTQVAGCFTGGTAGTPAVTTIVDPPRPLEPRVNQGETRFLYVRGGKGQISWRSSDSSIFSVAPLSQTVSDEEPLGNENILLSAGLNSSLFQLGNIADKMTVSNCTYDDIDGDETQDLVGCDVTLSGTIEYDLAQQNIPVTIVPRVGNPIQGAAQGSGKMTGTITGTATLLAEAGGTVTATGTMTGTVTGDVVGGVTATVSVSVPVSIFTSPGDLINEVNTAGINATGTLAKDSTLLPINRSGGGDSTTVSTFAVLTAKRPGRATLFASEASGCAVPYEIEVLGQKLIIDLEDPSGTGVFEVGDSIQLHAWTGYKGAINADNDITNVVEWTSDNTAVATVSPTGRVEAKQPGTANITARYTSGSAETGTLTSENSVRIRVNKIAGLTLTADQATLGKLSPDERAASYRTVALMINKASASGHSITLEGQVVSVALPPLATYRSDLERIQAITNDLATNLAITGITVTKHPTLPGVLILRASGTNTSVDISTTAAFEEIAILPGLSSVTLPQGESYGLQVIGEYDSGVTKLMNLRDVTWVSDPVNRLNDTALVAGRLERGDLGGVSRVFAEITNPDGSVIRSNTIEVNVPSGPSVDFVRILGSGAILRGGRVNLSVKISDFDTIQDIQDIAVWIVKSNFTTYGEINADPNAVWFDLQTYPQLIEVTESGTGETPSTSTTPAATTPAETAPTSMIDWLIGKAYAQTSRLYRVYSIPVDIPVDARLVDGNYKLILSITDKAGNVVNQVISIRIGAVAQGDVNGDGRLNMIDVILAFQISTGNLSPTPRQLDAANLDGRAGITMIDVILLFRLATGAGA